MPISILLVDDTAAKRARVDEYIRMVCQDMDMAVIVVEAVASAADALRLLKVAHFDLMILDLMLPVRNDSEPSHHGGRDLLRKIFSLHSVNVPEHIIALTAFEEIRSEQMSDLGAKGVAVVTYSPDSDEWKESVAAVVQRMSTRLRAASLDYDVDLAIVTALHLVELEAVLELPAGWQSEKFEFDPTIYHRGAFAGAEGRVSVVASSASQMGMPHAAALTMKLISRFRPRFVCMVGIAAGVKGAFGDILVPYNVWDYGSGKLVEISMLGALVKSGFLPRPYHIGVDPFVETSLHDFSLNHDRVLSELWSSWDGERPGQAPKVHYGTIASGASVVAKRSVIDDIRSRNDKMIGLEMEIFGVFAAGRMASPPAPRVFAIKSICDFADERKGDEYQRYAAYTSARYLYEFAVRYLGRRLMGR